MQSAATRTDLVAAYLRGATIAYPCWQGGMVLNRFDGATVEYRNEGDTAWVREHRDPATAAARIPSDARLVA